MYPDLSYFLHDLFGTAPDNWTSIFKVFGLLLVSAILTGSYFFYRELKRKAENGTFKAQKVRTITNQSATIGDMVSNGFFGLILGWKVPYIAQHFPEFQRDAADVLLSAKGYPLIGILLALIFAAYRYWEVKKNAKTEPRERVEEIYPHDRIGDITIIAAISGVVGAKLFAVIEDIPSLLADPLGMLLSGSGLAIYGGLIGGFIGCYIYLRKYNIPFKETVDAVAPALFIAYAVGRMGCQLAGDGDWGIVAAAQPEWWFLPDWLWSFDYPQNVNNDGGEGGFMKSLIAGCDPECFKTITVRTIEDACQECCGVRYCHVLNAKVYPTPLYEIAMSLSIFGILMALRKRTEMIPGLLFFIYLIFNGTERFIIEKIRVNDVYEVGTFQLTQAEQISLGMFLIGLVGAIYLWRQSKNAT